MTSRRIAIAAAVLLHLFAFSLDAQVTQQTLSAPTPQTRQQLTRTLQEYREKKDLHGETVTLLQLGIAEVGLGNVDGARNNLAEAARKMRAQNDVMGAWLALNILSQLEVALGRPAEAIVHIENAFNVINEAKTSTAPLTFKTFKALGAASGFPPQMFHMLDGPGAEMMKPMMLQYFLEPMTHDSYGTVLTQVGQLEKAEAELKAAAAGFAHSRGMYDFSIEAHWGDLRFRQKRYDEARTHYTKALNSSSQPMLTQMGDQHQQIKAGIYDRLVRLETITGHPEEAKRWSEKARELSKKPLGPK
jgi:tetratricopeptide (TPR) repeat protein